MRHIHYSERGDLCRECGFASFPDYMKSATWFEIRARLEAFHGTVCSLCGETARHWHHSYYSEAILLGEGDAAERNVFPICAACDQKVRFDEKGRERRLAAVLSTFRRLRKEYESLTPEEKASKAKDARYMKNAMAQALRAERAIRKEQRIIEAKKRLPRL